MNKTIFLLILIASFFVACKTTKLEVQDNSEVITESKSNVLTKTDSTSKQISIFEENERLETNDKIIIFGEGGGTYNSETGEAENVDKVIINDKKTETSAFVKIDNETQTEKTEQIDSTSNVIELRDVTSEEKTGNGTAWAVWVLVGAGVVIVLFIATKFFL
jgi:hypothetical protein